MDVRTLGAWLDRLDSRVRPVLGLDQRLSPRFEYRPETLTLHVGDEDDPVPYAVAGRNISREGVGVLAGQFIYPQSACRVRLTSPFGTTQEAAGCVARCRYVLGSGSLYEVGVQFDDPIDVTLFAPRARHASVLVFGADMATTQLIEGFFRTENAGLTSLADFEEAVATVVARSPDLVLIDVDQRAADGFELAQRLRSEGYVGPVLAMTVQVSAEVRNHCASCGCTGYLCKPLHPKQLHDLLRALADQPLVSSLAHDPALAPLVDAFVAGLRARVAELSRASQAHDLPEVVRLVRDLRAQAGSYGFEPISEEAGLVEALCAVDAPADELQPALHNLLDACLRARPARGPT
jgi:DNA-binding response OmpR family regulator